MGELFIGIMGGIAILIGLAISMTRRDTAERMQDASKYWLAPEGIYSPGAAGCAGIVFTIFGVGMVILAIVRALT